MAVQRKYLEMFLEEGGEILSKLDQRILRLEATPDDAEALQSALRLAHTLKGGAKMVGLDNVSRAAHGVETLLKATAGSGRRLAGSETSAVLELLDRVRGVLGLVAEGRESEALGRDLGSDGQPTGDLERTPPRPPPRAPQPEPRPSESEPEAPGGRRLGSDRLRVSVGRLDELQNLVDDLVLQKVKLTNRMRRLRRVFRGLDRVNWDAPEGVLSRRDRELVQKAVRVLAGRGFAEFNEDLHHIDRMTSEIQNQVLELRMVPLAEVLDEYYRAVRDLAHDLGKDVELTIDGRFTEIDKRLLEAVQGPLMHLVRNAVDHGIESPSERAAAGKPPRGRVTVRAYHKGSAVVIEVEDDGRGLRCSNIRDKALREGFLTPEQADAASDEEIRYLLCEPGFTTREAVTEVSGRGVGLDVVRVELERLKGSLAIQSEAGAYTRFRLFLPLSISTLSALIVRVGGMFCAIPSLFVDRCFKVPAAEFAARDGTLVHAGRLLPAVSLARLMGEGGDTHRKSVGVVVLQFRGRVMPLQVDSFDEERPVVLKPIGEHLAGVRFVLGVSFLADEQPVPILNVLDLHAHWARLETTCRFQGAASPRIGRVLVVDDSMTTRHMERTILEGLGYQVLQASDGADAWQRLQTEPVDLVLTDVEMPEMDGLELTRRIRASEQLGGLPIVVVSNRTADEDVEAGWLAGADAYLGKDRFSQRELSATLRGLLAQGKTLGPAGPVAGGGDGEGV